VVTSNVNTKQLEQKVEKLGTEFSEAQNFAQVRSSVSEEFIVDLLGKFIRQMYNFNVNLMDQLDRLNSALVADENREIVQYKDLRNLLQEQIAMLQKLRRT